MKLVGMNTVTATSKPAAMPGLVKCPICTHNVSAGVIATRKGAVVAPGQSCPRCASKLDAAYVLRIERAA